LGQDVSIVFAAREVAGEQLIDAATRAFADSRPENLVLLWSRHGPACVRAAVPNFTSVSVWADAEDGLARFASELSRLLGKVAVITLADHSCVGGWRVFENGQAGQGDWCEGEGYTECGIQGVERCLEVELRPTEEERLWFVESFLEQLSGVCVFGSVEGLQPGAPLYPGQIRAIIESDLPGAEMECLLLVG
jgi:hypothetical protein